MSAAGKRSCVPVVGLLRVDLIGGLTIPLDLLALHGISAGDIVVLAGHDGSVALRRLNPGLSAQRFAEPVQ
ncbi:MAG: hypothetical protein JSR59_04030 [Proteobacteria bacterium]|nr:hypothetical protein [Pseudomonadota bacterium]